MLIYKTDADVLALVEAFEKRTLPKAEWTHAAHLTVGLYYCLNYPFGAARNLIRDGIYWLNDTHGTANTETSGYHETITCFWTKTVNDFLAKRDRGAALAVLANDLVLSCGDPNLPLRFYSRELLFSVEARLNYVAPDLETDELFYENFAPEVFA